MRSTLLTALTAALALSASTGCQTSMLAVGGFGTAPATRTVVSSQGPEFRADVQVSVSFFGIPLAGAQDVVFVLDRSGSMSGVSAGVAGQDVGMGRVTSALVGVGATLANNRAHALPTKLEAAQDELAHTLAAMPDGTRFTIIFFDDEIAAFSPTLRVLDASTRAEAIAFARGIRPGDSTAAVPALRLAYQAGAARVVLLSDGLPNDGGGASELLAEARMQIRRGVRFDTVGLGIDQDASLLRTLAGESGGLVITR